MIFENSAFVFQTLFPGFPSEFNFLLDGPHFILTVLKFLPGSSHMNHFHVLSSFLGKQVNKPW